MSEDVEINAIGASGSKGPEKECLTKPADEPDEAEEGHMPLVMSRGTKDQAPSQEEWDEHMTTHLPLRSWCPHCVKGKCVTGQHLTKDKEESRLSTVHRDYCFLCKKIDSESEEHYESRRGAPVLVALDSKTKPMFGRVRNEQGCARVRD